MTSKIYSCVLQGIEAHGVEIEVDILRGLSRFTVVGLGDKAVQESKERIRSAIVNSGFEFPKQRKVINLAPADLKKCGPGLDLAMAMGLLVESHQTSRSPLKEALLVGELALDGSLRSTEGILSCALFAKRAGFKELYVPAMHAEEAALVSGIDVFPVENLVDLVAHLDGSFSIPLASAASNFAHFQGWNGAIEAALKGLPSSIPSHSLRGLVVAAAGGHHLLLSGSPGCGKTLLASHFPFLLPPLSETECIELTQIYSAAGVLPPGRPLIMERPFRSIHPTASVVSLIGGGSTIRPGEISLAHHGVLFLDEVAEFPRGALETLRQPLEEKQIMVSRASGSVTFPAHFTLVAAMNPCPCGYFQDTHRACRCTAAERRRYQNKLSGPFLDRIDLFLEMKRVSFQELHSETNDIIDLLACRAHVDRARARQRDRLGTDTRLNCDLTPAELRTACVVSSQSAGILEHAMDRGELSARGYSRVLKVARTLADMDDEESIDERHLLEAMSYHRVNVGAASLVK